MDSGAATRALAYCLDAPAGGVWGALMRVRCALCSQSVSRARAREIADRDGGPSGYFAHDDCVERIAAAPALPIDHVPPQAERLARPVLMAAE